MLQTLTLKNFILAENLEIEFSGGFCVLTGETGAGKSLLIDALQCVTGARADSSMIREGESKAEVVAEFRLPKAGSANFSAILALLDEWAIDNDDIAHTINLRRVLDVSGRNKAFINGSVVTTTQLSQIGDLLLEIHGQHDSILLMKSAKQRDLLDVFAGLTAEVILLGSLWSSWQEHLEKLKTAEQSQEGMEREREYLQKCAEDLQSCLEPKEWEDINRSHQKLTHVQSLIANAYRAIALLEDDDTNADSLLQSAKDAVAEMAEVDEGVSATLDLVESAQQEILEAVRALRAYVEKLDADPATLATIEETISHHLDMARKYRVRPEELRALYHDTQTKLSAMDEGMDLAGLMKKVEELSKDYYAKSTTLSLARQKAAKALGDKVTARLPDLGMKHAEFQAHCETASAGPFGIDQVEFQVRGLAGSGWKAMAKVASGGELSRLSLSLFLALHGAEPKTYVFDEVDAGIGGGVAEAVGKMLRELGEGDINNDHKMGAASLTGQILCVTHLPQVASKAHWHALVEKQQTNDGTTLKATSNVRLLVTLVERQQEIARMLGGQKMTEATLAHALEMLSVDAIE